MSEKKKESNVEKHAGFLDQFVPVKQKKVSSKTLKELFNELQRKYHLLLRYTSSKNLIMKAGRLHSFKESINEAQKAVEVLVASLTDLRKEYDDKLKVAEKENELLEGCYYEGRRDGVNEVLAKLGAKEQKKENYENKRDALVKERIRLMNLLESQEDFPDPKTLIEYEKNKRQIIDLDSKFEAQEKGETE